MLLSLACLGASPAPAASPVPAAVVHINDFKYAPTPVTVKTGDTVEFINDDFTKPGKYSYFCALHPWMKAVVIVKPSSH
jgi:plastocyanin